MRMQAPNSTGRRLPILVTAMVCTFSVHLSLYPKSLLICWLTPPILCFDSPLQESVLLMPPEVRKHDKHPPAKNQIKYRLTFSFFWVINCPTLTALYSGNKQAISKFSLALGTSSLQRICEDLKNQGPKHVKTDEYNWKSWCTACVQHHAEVSTTEEDTQERQHMFWKFTVLIKNVSCYKPIFLLLSGSWSFERVRL